VDGRRKFRISGDEINQNMVSGQELGLGKLDIQEKVIGRSHYVMVPTHTVTV